MLDRQACGQEGGLGGSLAVPLLPCDDRQVTSLSTGLLGVPSPSHT